MAPRYSWNPEIIYPYESLWSLFQKFMTWNYCSPIALWQNFNRTKYPYPTGKKNILSSQTVDLLRFKRCLRLPEEQMEASQLSHFLESDEVEILSAKSLRFCPQCLMDGYHSTIQQILIIEKCPHHETQLIKNCTSCLEPIKLTFESSAEVAPFSCKSCGHLFTDPDRLFENSSSPERDKKYINAAKWFIKRKLFPREDRQSTTLWVGREISEARKRAKLKVLPGIWSDMLGEEAPFHSPNRHNKYTKKSYELNSLNNTTIFRNGYLEALDEIRGLLRNHLGCIDLIHQLWWPDIYHAKSIEESSCIYGHAFVLWRMRCEDAIRPDSLGDLENVADLNAIVFEHLRGQTSDEAVRKEILVSFFWECVFLARHWRRSKVLRFDVRYIQGRNIPYWYKQTKPDKQEEKMIIWVERVAGVSHPIAIQHN